MDKKEIEIDSKNYRLSRMPVWPDQFHIGRKLGPFIAKIGPVIKKALEEGGKTDSDLLMEMFDPISEVLAEMSEADSEFVMAKCFKYIERQDGDRWAKAFASNGRPMYSDIDLKIMVQLVIAMLRENFSDFFSAPPTPQLPGAPA